MGNFYKKNSLEKYKKIKNKLTIRALDFKIKNKLISTDYKKILKLYEI